MMNQLEDTEKKKKISINDILDKLGVVIALVVLIVVMAVLSPDFLTVKNVFNILQQIAQIGIISVGMTFVILLGGIDLSVGSIIAFTGLIMALCMKAGMSVGLAILVGIILGAAIGFLNGILISKVKLQPFIATLGTMTMARGLAYTITNGQPVYSFSAGFKSFAGFIGVVPIPAIIMAVIFALGYYVLKYTKFGRYMYAIGGNRVASKLSGINVDKYEMLVYTISGICCAIAAIILTARLDSAVPVAGDGNELDAIAAVAIGGTSMTGGEGGIVGTLIGALIMGVIANGMNLLDVQQGPQRFAKGAIIILAVGIDVIRKKRTSK
ncbi:ribose transport system permease protein RbsC [Clostridium ragsdalei P11]|uniref:Ribose transport system permease protein RbsC n=1 Tax=Clostridium ragsdalei P11 TaxID=1353534 RepID=A0A1A6AMY1_9CLOT|nr:ribose ABC transporter permease [Clostridium ragsdalei]OBR91378.1 ribose transport system permease protein RbsC [Clostridium ragsdalei P11]